MMKLLHCCMTTTFFLTLILMQIHTFFSLQQKQELPLSSDDRMNWTNLCAQTAMQAIVLPDIAGFPTHNALLRTMTNTASALDTALLYHKPLFRHRCFSDCKISAFDRLSSKIKEFKLCITNHKGIQYAERITGIDVLHRRVFIKNTMNPILLL